MKAVHKPVCVCIYALNAQNQIYMANTMNKHCICEHCYRRANSEAAPLFSVRSILLICVTFACHFIWIFLVHVFFSVSVIEFENFLNFLHEIKMDIIFNTQGYLKRFTRKDTSFT